ncbi:MAG: NADH-quinone oxidoreductase subunit J [Planctomycetota bacterium]|nr:MAG: NADH-quinone oxidoreductase subunit J [Planctomycetota bacterium]
MATALFYLFGAGALFSAANVVFRRQAVPAAIWLVTCFFFLAGEFLLLGFPFLAAIQIMVYVGAIMVLFLFVIMLLDLQAHQPIQSQFRHSIGGALALVLVALAFVAASGGQALEAENQPAAPEISALVEALFTRYLLPFEVTSVVLVAAIVGALTLGRSPGGSDHPAKS